MNPVAKFFTLSPHLRTAIILAPLLAIAGYVAAGYYMAGKQSAKQPPGTPALELRAVGDCRILAGECRFRRDSLVINLGARSTEQGDTLIQLQPDSPIQGAVMGVHLHGNETPRNMRKIKGEDNWYMLFSGKLETPVKMRVIAVQNGSSYFAELTAN